MRIIPARAGFTAGERSERTGRMDHPRSRGVYSLSPALRGSGTGSSPLARGLPINRGDRTIPGGIIPARAGFTRSTTAPSRLWRDHPRSRGVYVISPFSMASRKGSSPLARGLPGSDGAHSGRHGIIPARAGFTVVRTPRKENSWDHPRSRGVYIASIDAYWSRLGSSPLARGLPTRRHGRARIERIIPARAGFTRSGVREVCEAWDHPRSRGVYLVVGVKPRKGRGSSPLARGLRPPPRVRREHHGIIPARAGFTSGGP